MRSKYFCLTVNNYTPNDVLHYRSLVGRSLATYGVIGFEVGENGTRHLQAYIELSKRVRLTGARQLFPNAHIEARRGTAIQARDYCKKDGTFDE